MKPKTQSSIYIEHFRWFGETRITSVVKQHLGKMKNEAKKAHDNYGLTAYEASPTTQKNPPGLPSPSFSM
ncbi:MAG: hypothetical protein Q9221_007384 [Calogaya cf. arnoldii]